MLGLRSTELATRNGCYRYAYRVEIGYRTRCETGSNSRLALRCQGNSKGTKDQGSVLAQSGTLGKGLFYDTRSGRIVVRNTRPSHSSTKDAQRCVLAGAPTNVTSRSCEVTTEGLGHVNR